MKTSRILLVLFFCFAFVGVVDDCCLSSSISVSPVKIEEVISGADDTFYITVTNPGVESVQVDVSCRELLQMQDGLITLGNKPDAFPWMSIYPESFKLDSFQKQTVGINIRSVPKGVTGTYCAIVFSFSSLSTDSDKVFSSGQIIAQMFLDGPEKGRIEGEIKDVNVTPGILGGEFRVDVGFENTGTELVAASCNVSLMNQEGEIVASKTAALKKVLPEVYVMPFVILKAPYGIFDEMDFYDIVCEITCADVFNPTGIKVFRNEKRICVLPGGHLVFPELRIVDVRVPVVREGEPVRGGALISNTGNMVLTVDGLIRVSSFDGELILQQSIEEFQLLPELSWFVEFLLEKSLSQGEYLLDVDFKYSTKNDSHEVPEEISSYLEQQFKTTSRAVLNIKASGTEINMITAITGVTYVDGLVAVEIVMESKGVAITYEGLGRLFDGDGTLLGYIPIERGVLESGISHMFTKFWHGHLVPGVYEVVLSVFAMELDKMMIESVFFTVLPQESS